MFPRLVGKQMKHWNSRICPESQTAESSPTVGQDAPIVVRTGRETIIFHSLWELHSLISCHRSIGSNAAAVELLTDCIHFY